MSVEENSWTIYPSSDFIGITSSQSQWTILDSSKNLSTGQAQFYVKFLKEGLFYTITATDLSGSYGTADSLPIPVTVTGFGNAAVVTYTIQKVSSAVRGMKNIYMMDIIMTNPNSGGAQFELMGVTMSASSAVNQAVQAVTAMDASGNTLSTTNWGAAKQIFVPAGIMAGPMQSVDMKIYFDISPDAPGGSFFATVDGPMDVVMQKLDGTSIYADPTSSAFPFKTDVINIIETDLNGSFYNYPNPFRAGSALTTIQYYLPDNSKVSLKIYDLIGRKVKTIFEEKQETGGTIYRLTWDGKNDDGNLIVNGVYYGILKINGNQQYETKIVVVK